MSTKKLTLREAIETALVYENNVRDLYREAAKKASEEGGRKLFDRLAKDEQIHVAYLRARQKEWIEKGKMNIEVLKTLVPAADRIADGLAQLEHKIEDYDWKVELELLKKARQMESETGGFYKRMVQELDEDGILLFRGFLEIEDAHYDLVQAQIGALEGGGYWFDTQEFHLEGA